ncbi:MAG: zinc ribbon domain-containing protein [Candidatus Heimdallarchaeota archaeon]|nr:zinc ribbon domain-containing protein [Candidatus Heimdallarchaeota archaeon]MCK5049093.1 zinc ribbon domain-containing protein [Candidatus Heimdallarchaeota archaeon]
MLILKKIEIAIFGSIILCAAILTITANADLWEVMGWLEFEDTGYEPTEEEEDFLNKEGLIKLFTLTSISIIAIVGSLGLKNYWETDIDEPSLKALTIFGLQIYGIVLIMISGMQYTDRLYSAWLGFGSITVVSMIGLYIMIKSRQTTSQTAKTIEIRCHKCSFSILPGYQVCPNCGINASANCRQCGATVKESFNLCPMCATPLQQKEAKLKVRL